MLRGRLTRYGLILRARERLHRGNKPGMPDLKRVSDLGSSNHSLACISLGVALWFSAIALKRGWQYLQLDGATTATALEWRVKKLSLSKYALTADYEYTVKGVVYKGKTTLKSPRFLNPFTAEHERRSYLLKTWTVWHSKSDPRIASLERRFPQKQIMHALLTLGVFAYFYCARGILSKLIIEF